MGSNTLVKVVLLSSGLTLLVTFSVLYAGRTYVHEWLTASVSQPEAVEPSASDALTIPEVVDRATDAVVSVVVTKDVPIYERYYEEYQPFGGWFGSGFVVPRVRERGTEEQEVGGGSGFIVSPDGHIVTNRHVVSDESARYSVVLNDGMTYGVQVLARDEVLDVAILAIDDLPSGTVLPYLTFGDSDSLQLGEPVIAIGNALAEFRNSVSVGVVSGLARTIVASDRQGMREQLDEVIQTDAAINPGNSGGPLLNARGEVIGVNVAATLGADNISFALPARAVEGIVTSVQETGEIIRPFLGVRYTMVNERVRREYDLGVSYGALITPTDTDGESSIVPGSPAQAAGLAPGEVILAIDGILLESRTLASVLRGLQVGATIDIRVWSPEGERTVQATLQAAP